MDTCKNINQKNPHYYYYTVIIHNDLAMQIILFFSSKGLAVTAYTLIMNIHEKRYTQYILMLVLLQFLRQGGAASGVVGEVGGVSRMRDS